MELDSKRQKYLILIILNHTMMLKDYEKLDLSVTFNELKYMIFRLSEKTQYKLILEKRLKELQEIYPIEQYPEKWI